MPTNPQNLTDLVKVPILIVQGSQPTGSVARAILVSTFAATDAFPGRQVRLSGTAPAIDAELESMGFAADSKPRAMAAAFFDNELPVDEVVIGRRDAGDASWTATLQALDAEDDTWCLIACETRTKAEQVQIANYMESRWGYYRTLTYEPGALTKQAGTFVNAAFTAKYQHTSATYYDAEVATGYGPPIILSLATPIQVENGQTLKLAVQDGDPQTFTFAATAATILGSAQVSAINLADGENIVVEVDALGEIDIVLEDDASYFPDGIEDATAAQVVDYLNDIAPQLTWSVDAGAVRATSQRKGTLSLIDFTGGTAATKLGLSGEENGTGDFEFADAATAAEMATKINATGTGFVAAAVGTKLKLTGDAPGEDQYLELLESEVLANLGLEVGKYYGTGVTEDWHDCAVLGVLAQLASRLDSPGGRFPLDNQKLRGRPGQVLTATQRKNLWEQNCDTYELRTDNYPGELHLGVSFSGANADFVVGTLWLQLRMVEAIKGLKDSYAARKLNVPYGDDGIAIMDNPITTVLTLAGSNGLFKTPIDFSPFDPLTKVTGYKKPTIAEQSEANRAAQRVSGWKTTQLDAGTIKIVEVEITASTQ